MERILCHYGLVMEIAKREDILKPILFLAVESAPRNWLICIAKGPEEHVPDRKICEILSMVAVHVMNPVGFGALEEETHRAGSFDVPVIEKLRDCGNEGSQTGGFQAAPQ